MRAIVFEDNNGVKNFLPFSSEKKLFEVFGKICKGSGTFFCVSEEQFEQMKEQDTLCEITDFFYKKFVGAGAYDFEGNFHSSIMQDEGKYWIEDYIQKTNEIIPCRILIEKILLN